jgi:hypothetical protein
MRVRLVSLAALLGVVGAQCLTACSGDGGPSTPEEKAAAHVAFLADPGNSWRILYQGATYLFRDQIARTYPEQVNGLLSLGSAAGKALAGRFTGVATFDQDPSLCVDAYLLERLDYVEAIPVLVAWLQTNKFGDVLKAPSCVTHALKVLSRQTDLNTLDYSYTPEQMDDTVARASGARASTAMSRSARRIIDNSGGVCTRRFTITSKTDPSKKVEIDGKSFSKDFKDFPAPATQQAIEGAKAGDEPYDKSGWNSAPGSEGAPSRLSDCIGNAVARTLKPNGTTDQILWNSNDNAKVVDIAKTFGKKEDDLSKAPPGKTLGLMIDPKNPNVAPHLVTKEADANGQFLRSKDGNGGVKHRRLSGEKQLPAGDGMLEKYKGATLELYSVDPATVDVVDPEFCTVPDCQLTGCPASQICQDDGTCAADPRGVHYGPTDVPADHWVSTGGTATIGDIITVEANGTIIFKNGNTCGIDGCGYWGWWELAAKVGTQVTWVGSSGTMVAEQDGPVELGLPRGTTFVPEDYASTDPNANTIIGSTTVADIWIKSF